MDRDGVVDEVSDATLSKSVGDGVTTPGEAHGVLVPDVFAARGHDGRDESGQRLASSRCAFRRRSMLRSSFFASWTRPMAAAISVGLKFVPSDSCSYRTRIPWFRYRRTRSARSSSSVVAMPPSPLVTFLVAYRLNMAGPKAPGTLALVGRAHGLRRILDDGRSRGEWRSRRAGPCQPSGHRGAPA